MIRKLLKRKLLKPIIQKKLKTSIPPHTALSMFAGKQLFSQSNNLWHIKCPNPHSLKKIFHRSQRHPLQWFQEWYNFSNGIGGVMRQKNAELESLQINTNMVKPRSDYVSRGLEAEKVGLAFEWPMVKGELDMKLQNQVAENIVHWRRYKLFSETKVKQNFRAEKDWLLFYSLDQLSSYLSKAIYEKKESYHKTQLIERRKTYFLYGKLLGKHWNMLRRKSRAPLTCSRHNNISLLMESRLCQAVKKCFLFSTTLQAHHWISQGKICVNGRVVRSSAYQIKSGDVVSIKKEMFSLYQRQLELLWKKQPIESKWVVRPRLSYLWLKWTKLLATFRRRYDYFRWLGALDIRLGPINTHFTTQQTLPGLKEVKKKPIKDNISYKGRQQLSQKANNTTFKYTYTLYSEAVYKWCKKGLPPLDTKSGGYHNIVSFGPQNSIRNKIPHLPDRDIQNYWYRTGRFAVNRFVNLTDFFLDRKAGCGAKKIHTWLKKLLLVNPFLWNKKHFSHRMSNNFRKPVPPRAHLPSSSLPWKKIYRGRAKDFNMWLLDNPALACDGLFHLRGKLGLIRKKSFVLKNLHRGLSLQKPLNFEINYKQLQAVCLYPPQVVRYPRLVDFKKL